MKSFALKAFLDILQASAGARSGELIRPQNNLFHSFPSPPTSRRGLIAELLPLLFVSAFDLSDHALNLSNFMLGFDDPLVRSVAFFVNKAHATFKTGQQLFRELEPFAKRLDILFESHHLPLPL